MKFSSVALFIAGALCLIFVTPVTHYLTYPSDNGRLIGLLDIILYLLPFVLFCIFLTRAKGSDFRFVLILFSIAGRVLVIGMATGIYNQFKMSIPDDAICVIAAALGSFVDGSLIIVLMREIRKGTLSYPGY